LDLKGRTYQEAVENCIMRSFTIYTLHQKQYFIRMIKPQKMRWAAYVMNMCQMRSAYMISECLKGRDHLEDLGIDGRIMLNLSQINRNRRVWTGLIWLSAVTSGWLL
jgi:hypothetical protein